MSIDTKVGKEGGLSYKVMDACAEYVPRGIRKAWGSKAGGYTSLGVMASGIVLGGPVFFGGLALFTGYLGCKSLNQYVGEEKLE